MHRLVAILLTAAVALSAMMGLSSGGRVLCIGSDHVAVEFRHQECPAQSSHDADHDSALPDSDPSHPAAAGAESCIDFELSHSAGTQSLDRCPAQPSLAPFLFPPPLWITLPQAVAGIAAEASLDDPPLPSPACLRSIVLLI